MKVLVIAPHADDESLGCGGTLLRLRRENPQFELHWALITEMKVDFGFTAGQVAQRQAEIEKVARAYAVSGVHRLGFPPACLETVGMANVIGSLAKVVDEVKPDTVFVPFRYDVHTDHRVVFDAAIACTKVFRHTFVKRVLAYETMSETDFCLDPGIVPFHPNVWVDISDDLNRKIEVLGHYAGEMGQYPFPRSAEAVTAQARLRGIGAGVAAAEAFMLLKGIF